MAIRIVRLGSPRVAGEGLRIGAVRHPPRGVPKARRGPDDWFDVWYPNLAPSAETLSRARAEDDAQGWRRFARRYRREMDTPENRRTLELLAALSHRSDLPLGCYCEDESRCHRAILRELLAKHGALLG